MCGIAGVWGKADGERTAWMMDRLAHRGPDAAGMHQAEAGVLGHRRLSIIDPAGGNQPLYNETGRQVIVANGEVYNHRELRRDLSGRHRFGTASDTETVLHLLEEEGAAAVGQLDGMFALAAADDERLLLARDPLGIKPLYLGRGRDAVYFASELKALVGLPEVAVEEFPNGCWYDSRHGLRRYWGLRPRSLLGGHPDRLAMRVRAALEQAVSKRLMSDVPLGAFLSGGLDSSALCALAKRELGRLQTFAVGIEGSPDILAARRVADHLGTEHHEYCYTAAEVIEHLPTILYHLESFDQDLVRSAIPCYFCARLAARQVKVVLTGEGADELFAGYRYQRALSGAALHDELHRSVGALHNINLQRVDRLTMAHGLEGRVPFLDLAVVDLALRLPPALKLYRTDDGRLIEKYLLRLAVADLLPDEIVWRDKQQFDEGSGTVDLLAEALDGVLSDFDAAAYRHAHPEARLRSAEEAWYHRLLSEVFEGSPVVLGNVARWSER